MLYSAKKQLALCFTTYVFFGMAESVNRVVMLNHFIYDVNPNTAQRNLSISRFVLRGSAMAGNLILPMFTGKKDRFYKELIVTCFVTSIAYFAYSVSTSITITYIAIAVAGLCQILIFIVYCQLNAQFDEEKRTGAVIFLKTTFQSGLMLGSFFRFLPVDYHFYVFNLRVTGSTTSAFVVGLTFLSISIVAIFMSLSECTQQNHTKEITIFSKKEEEEEKKKSFDVNKGVASKDLPTSVVFTAGLWSMVVHFNTEAINVLQQEFSTSFHLSNTTSAALFALRYALAIVFNMVTVFWLLPRMRHDSLLILWQTLRMLVVSLCFWAHLLPKTQPTFMLFVVVCVIDPFVYYNDDAVLLTLLSRYKNMKIYMAGILAFWQFGYALTFLIPLFYNFLEIVFAFDMLLISTCLVLGVVNGMLINSKYF